LACSEGKLVHLGIGKAKFRFNNKLLSLDSTTLSLCLSLFPWAEFRRAKGGVKAHVLPDHDDYLPRYVLITEARCSDVRVAQSLDLNPDPGRRTHPVHGRPGGPGLPAYPAAGGVLGRAPGARDRLVDQPVVLERGHHRCHLQGPLGD
jgi:hypothetical protein